MFPLTPAPLLAALLLLLAVVALDPFTARVRY